MNPYARQLPAFFSRLAKTKIQGKLPVINWSRNQSFLRGVPRFQPYEFSFLGILLLATLESLAFLKLIRHMHEAPMPCLRAKCSSK